MGTAENIRMHQRQIIKDQDEGLGELSKALRNQQRMGRDMQDEIQEHNGKGGGRGEGERGGWGEEGRREGKGERRGREWKEGEGRGRGGEGE